MYFLYLHFSLHKITQAVGCPNFNAIFVKHFLHAKTICEVTFIKNTWVKKKCTFCSIELAFSSLTRHTNTACPVKNKKKVDQRKQIKSKKERKIEPDQIEPCTENKVDKSGELIPILAEIPNNEIIINDAFMGVYTEEFKDTEFNISEFLTFN